MIVRLPMYLMGKLAPGFANKLFFITDAGQSKLECLFGKFVRKAPVDFSIKILLSSYDDCHAECFYAKFHHAD